MVQEANKTANNDAVAKKVKIFLIKNCVCFINFGIIKRALFFALHILLYCLDLHCFLVLSCSHQFHLFCHKSHGIVTLFYPQGCTRCIARTCDKPKMRRAGLKWQCRKLCFFSWLFFIYTCCRGAINLSRLRNTFFKGINIL